MAYHPGRDDTRWGKLARELGAARTLADYEVHVARSAAMNRELAGCWHVWFVALGGAVEWLARPAGQGEPLLSAWTADELAALIEAQR
jgi:hypothetical protein